MEEDERRRTERGASARGNYGKAEDSQYAESYPPPVILSTARGRGVY